MAYLFNDPTEFADEYVSGLVAAHPTRLRAVSGGVARTSVTPPGGVAVVIGGGSGHYPAFGGLVGVGLAHGAALGNLFASPSSQQVQGVAKAVDSGAGVLFCFGNYAGDVLNFRLAADRLAADGTQTRIVAVTDDISSAAPREAHKRRGIAGGLLVYKCASAAADSGYSLAEVERIALKANERVRTLGVAFSGCTLPGATEPLFTVPAGRMAVGMGIHGEPGISEIDVPSADGLAELLVTSVLGDLPAEIESVAGKRVVVVVNGLGSVKYEELYVVYHGVAERLAARGIIVADSEVGEFITSFEMAGLSLSIFWLDDELERFWNAPVNSPAFRRGNPESPTSSATASVASSASAAVSPGSPESREVAGAVLGALIAIREMTRERADELGRLDAVAGDGDHGIGMQRGATAAVTAAETAVAEGAGAGSVLAAAADAWSNRAGGTSGVLWGLALAALGSSIGDQDRPSAARFAVGVADAAEAIAAFGHAEQGDKTMLDALIPFSAALSAASARGENVASAWAEAAPVARNAAAATADLTPRIGRARPHAAKSIGTPDPGAVSFAYAVSAALAAITQPEGPIQ